MRRPAKGGPGAAADHFDGRPCAQFGKEAKGILAQAVRRARAAGLAFDTNFVYSNYPWQAIIDAAHRHHCDAIFMGAHGRKGLARLVHGSETLEVLTHSRSRFPQHCGPSTKRCGVQLVKATEERGAVARPRARSRACSIRT
jgi:hypothetical protein